MEAVTKNGDLLEEASDELKNDKTIVLEAVRNSGNALLHASEDLKKDNEIILEAIKTEVQKNKFSIFSLNLKNIVDKEVFDDSNFMINALKIHPRMVEFLPSKFKNDKEIFREILEKSGSLLSYASKEIQSDKEMVLIAIKQYGPAIQN